MQPIEAPHDPDAVPDLYNSASENWDYDSDVFDTDGTCHRSSFFRVQLPFPARSVYTHLLHSFLVSCASSTFAHNRFTHLSCRCFQLIAPTQAHSETCADALSSGPEQRERGD